MGKLNTTACSLSREDLEKMARMRSDFLICFIEERSHFDAPFIEKCLNFARDCAAKHLEDNNVISEQTEDSKHA